MKTIAAIPLMLAGLSGCNKPPTLNESLICTGNQTTITGLEETRATAPMTYSLVIRGAGERVTLTLAPHVPHAGGISRDIFDNESATKEVTVMESSVIFTKKTAEPDSSYRVNGELLRGTGLISFMQRWERTKSDSGPTSDVEVRFFDGICQPVPAPTMQPHEGR
jgi:hypothetical protein